jgi:hypothetical protein
MGMQHLANWPVLFGTAVLTAAGSDTSVRSLYNSDLTRAAGMLAHFDWAIYDFNSGNFWSTIRERGLPFRVVLACDPFVHGQALFQEVSGCNIITNGAPALLDHIRGSGIMSKLTGYLFHSHPYCSTANIPFYTSSKLYPSSWRLSTRIMIAAWFHSHSSSAYASTDGSSPMYRCLTPIWEIHSLGTAS